MLKRLIKRMDVRRHGRYLAARARRRDRAMDQVESELERLRQDSRGTRDWITYHNALYQLRMKRIFM